MKNKTATAIVLLFTCLQAGAQIEHDHDGKIRNLILDADTISFFTDGPNRGPAYYVNFGDSVITASWTRINDSSFVTTIGNTDCSLRYIDYNDLPAINLTITNNGNERFAPVTAGIRLGIDTYMDSYPQWMSKYFPTLMRCEKNFFWGYLQSPEGKTIGLISPDPVASWSTSYNLGYQDPAPLWFMGHRIESLNIDLINTDPLPDSHPQNMSSLNPGQSRSWTIAFFSASEPSDVIAKIGAMGYPVPQMPYTTAPTDQSLTFSIPAECKVTSVTSPTGRKAKYHSKNSNVTVNLQEAGEYTVTTKSGPYIATSKIVAHRPWREVMADARKAALTYRQKATSHAESWYGFYSAFIAARWFPEPYIDSLLNRRFYMLFNKLHNCDGDEVTPLYYASRIQNTSTTISMLVDRFEAYADTTDLHRAAALADWLIDNWQRADGAYMNHGTIYTSVIYVAKSMLELYLCENDIAESDNYWRVKADRHYASAKKAIDQLVDSDGDFQTEGEMTFEDGMISCSALQIGYLATLQTDPAIRQHYTDAMLKILKSHNCLTQLAVPDGRRRGGTMRYWEAQYDVQMLPNMFNSPHGWSAWRAYATYYAYLLTGEESWLRETYNAMGAFSNLIDPHSGQLRWAFVADPYLQVEQTCAPDTTLTADDLSFGNPHPQLYDTKKFVIGEQYVPMVSDWQTVNTQDNDVHEVFKLLGETFLTQAFIVEQPDGSLHCYNCTAQRQGTTIIVTPSEPQITRLHTNMRRPASISFPGQVI